jgi:hypothetical protein
MYRYTLDLYDHHLATGMTSIVNAMCLYTKPSQLADSEDWPGNFGNDVRITGTPTKNVTDPINLANYSQVIVTPTFGQKLDEMADVISTWEAASADGLEDFIFYNNQGPVNWPYCDELTIGIAVNIDENMPYDAGAILALSSATENKMRIFLNADRTVQESAKNNGGNTYTVTSPALLHPGFN